MRCSKVRVSGRFLLASRPQEATVTIDREAGLFSVRPLRSRKQFILPLATVAEIVTQRIIKAEVAARKQAKKARGR